MNHSHPDNKYYCYRHIRPDKNVPFYVGFGTKKEDKNFTSHEVEYARAFSFGKNHRSKFWHEVFEKNKREIVVEILFECNDLKTIKRKEIEFIKLYGRRNKGTGTLVNLTDGGDGAEGFKHSDEFKKQVSQRNRNRVWTPEQRLEASLSRKGIPTGKPMPEHQREILLKANKGIKRTPEEKQRTSDGLKRWFSTHLPHNVTPIIQLTLDGEFVKEWVSISEAGRSLKVCNIHAALNGLQHKCGGFKWVYKKDYDAK